MIDWIMITNTLRSEHGSLEKVGRAAGVNAETIRQLNRGEITDPRYSTGTKIMNAYEPLRLRAEMWQAVDRLKVRAA